MASTYTGDPTTTSPADPVEISIPDDGDGLNAASVNDAFKMLADRVEWMANGYPDDEIPQFVTPAPIGGAGEYRHIASHAVGGGVYIRCYMHSGAGFLVWTVNALYTGPGATNWARDAAGDAGFVSISGLGLSTYYYPSASASPWATASWVGPTTAIGGALKALACVGDIQTTTGALDASGGDPAVGGGARVKAKQLVMSGSAPTANATNETGADNGAGDATETVVAGSNDARGRITVTTGAATAAGNIVIVTFNKAYPNAPEVMLTPTNADTANLGWVPRVASTTTTFTIASGTGGNVLAAATTYGWAYHVIG